MGYLHGRNKLELDNGMVECSIDTVCLYLQIMRLDGQKKERTTLSFSWGAVWQVLARDCSVDCVRSVQEPPLLPSSFTHRYSCLISRYVNIGASADIGNPMCAISLKEELVKIMLISWKRLAFVAERNLLAYQILHATVAAPTRSLYPE